MEHHFELPATVTVETLELWKTTILLLKYHSNTPHSFLSLHSAVAKYTIVCYLIPVLSVDLLFLIHRKQKYDEIVSEQWLSLSLLKSNRKFIHVYFNLYFHIITMENTGFSSGTGQWKSQKSHNVSWWIMSFSFRIIFFIYQWGQFQDSTFNCLENIQCLFIIQFPVFRCNELQQNSICNGNTCEMYMPQTHPEVYTVEIAHKSV